MASVASAHPAPGNLPPDFVAHGSRAITLDAASRDPITRGMRPEHVEPVFTAARAHARDRYLSALLCPSQERDALVALAAVVGEIERIPALVSEPMMGEIRLQWWADWLESLETGGNPETGNPLADALADVMAHSPLQSEPLLRLVDARILDLYADAPADGPAYTDYLDRAEGGPFRLAANICGVDTFEPEAEAAIRAAARAYGGVRVLFKLAFFVARGRWPLPPGSGQAEAQSLAGVDIENLREGAVRGEIEAIRSAAHSVSRDIRALPSPVARRLRRALRPVALVEPYLRHLEDVKPWTLAPSGDLSELARVWRLWTAKHFGKP